MLMAKLILTRVQKLDNGNYQYYFKRISSKVRIPQIAEYIGTILKIRCSIIEGYLVILDYASDYLTLANSLQKLDISITVHNSVYVAHNPENFGRKLE